MSLTKVNYIDNSTIITAKNLNDIQDNIIELQDNLENIKIKPKAGFIYPLASDVIPEGFLLCDGAEYLRDEYPELFAAIGTTWGAGDGSTTFNVPNLAERVPVGTGGGYALGATGGEKEHTLTVDEMPKHNHSFWLHFTAGSDSSIYAYEALGNSGTNQAYSGATASSGGNKSHNNMQPYTVVNYIIATGKDTGVSVADIITGAQALPLGVEYGGLGATNAADARRNLEITPENIGAISMELLWENASPTSEFAPQEIKFDYVGFTLVEIIFYSHITNGFVLSTGHINIDDRKHALFGTAFKSDDTDYDIATRPFTFTVEGINFESSKYNDLVGIDEARGSVKSNVPYKIYGIKGVN